ncbi:MAG TPA: LysR substrate-binding domain-containing protein [Burkholderiaceae bacterium]|nr:LysR substrate-binding domain-containing protein [Burkholderiaceae bacterium]
MNKKRAPRLSLDLLRGFRAAARHLSFTRAAQDLFVTQSAISREIKTLEEQLGQPLFRRVNRTLQLTPAGVELYRLADSALAQLDAGVERIAGASKVVTVTTTTGLASLWLTPRLLRFNRAHPGIDVRVVASNDKPNLERDQLDIAIRFVLADGDAPNSEPVFDCKIYPACSPALARDKLHPIKTPADLAHHVRLDYESMRDGRRLSLWDFWFEKTKIAHVKPTSTLQFPQYDQLVSAAIDGGGVGIAVLPHTAQHLHQKAFCIPFGMEAVALLGVFYIIRRSDVAQREAVEVFVDWLRSEVRRDAEHAPVQGTARGKRSMRSG